MLVDAPIVNLSAEQALRLSSLRPGLLIDVQVATPIADKRFRAEYVGMEWGKYFIFRYPELRKWGNLSDALFESNKVVVRFLLEGDKGEIVAFRSRIKGVCSHPSKLIFVHFPQDIASTCLRSAPRVKTLLTAQIKAPGVDIEGVITDLSESGCQFEGDVATLDTNLKGEKITVLTQGPDHQPIKFAASVVNQKSLFGRRYLGLSLDNPGLFKSMIASLPMDLDLLDEVP